MTLNELKIKCMKMLELQSEAINEDNIDEATNYQEIEYNALESINRCIALRLIQEKKLYYPNFNGIENSINLTTNQIEGIPYDMLLMIPYFVAGELGMEDNPSVASFNSNKFESYLSRLENAPEYLLNESKIRTIYNVNDM